ncbi:MAG: OadG family protein [Bacteroidota bacterium]
MLLTVDLQIDQISEGYIILITGLLIVFGALISLFLVFRFGMPYLLYAYMVIKIIIKGKNKKTEEMPVFTDEEFTGEIVAAISTAIHIYLNDQHDHENPILTIKQARKSYSPWSSKIYGTHNRL